MPDWHDLAGQIAEYLEPVSDITNSVFTDPEWQEAVLEHIVDGFSGLEKQLADIMYRYLRGGINVNEMARLIGQLQSGSMAAWDELGEVVPELDTDAIADVFQRTYTNSSEQVARAIRSQAAKLASPQRAEATFRFNITNPLAKRWAQERAADLVQRTTYVLRQQLRSIVAEAVAGDLTPMQAARMIAPRVGLTPLQRRTVDQLRRTQASVMGPSRAQARSTIAAQRMLMQRARTIARTEIMAAQNAGQLGLWQQKVKDRQLPPQVQKLWIIARDERLCQWCSQMQGARALAPLDGPWMYPTRRGEIMIQHPPGHPNCRCTHGLFIPEFLTGEQTRAVLVGDTITPLEKLRQELGAPTWMTLAAQES